MSGMKELHPKTDKPEPKYKLVTAKTNLKALLTPTEPFEFPDHSVEEVNQLSKDMVEALYHYQGIGISSNQLDWSYSKFSIFAMRGDPADFVIFNPRLATAGSEIVKLEEACLSFPGLVIPVKRPRDIRVRFAGPDGQMDSHTFTGITARCFLHEMNHLQGKLWFEGVSRINLERAIRQSKRRGFDYSAMGFLKYAKN